MKDDPCASFFEKCRHHSYEKYGVAKTSTPSSESYTICASFFFLELVEKYVDDEKGKEEEGEHDFLVKQSGGRGQLSLLR